MVSQGDEENHCETMERWLELNKNIVHRGCYMAWNMWAERNRFVFENSIQPLAVVSQRVGRQVEEFKEYTTRIHGKPGPIIPTSASRCCASPLGTVKINANAHLGVDGWVGTRVVACDSLGNVISAGVRRQ